MVKSANQMQVAADHLAQHDPVLAPLVVRFGLCPIKPHDNFYQELVDAIISQQLSVKAAQTIERRFCALFGSEEQFPSPEQIVSATVDELRQAGLSRAKASYVQDLARHVLAGKLEFAAFKTMRNEDITSELVAVKGIGEWTAHMFLIFSLGRLDVLPVGDLGIRNGIKQLYALDQLPGPNEIRTIAERNHWHPYESVASWYIWQSLDNTPTI